MIMYDRVADIMYDRVTITSRLFLGQEPQEMPLASHNPIDVISDQVEIPASYVAAAAGPVELGAHALEPDTTTVVVADSIPEVHTKPSHSPFIRVAKCRKPRESIEERVAAMEMRALALPQVAAETTTDVLFPGANDKPVAAESELSMEVTFGTQSVGEFKVPPTPSYPTTAESSICSENDESAAELVQLEGRHKEESPLPIKFRPMQSIRDKRKRALGAGRGDWRLAKTPLKPLILSRKSNLASLSTGGASSSHSPVAHHAPADKAREEMASVVDVGVEAERDENGCIVEKKARKAKKVRPLVKHTNPSSTRNERTAEGYGERKGHNNAKSVLQALLPFGPRFEVQWAMSPEGRAP